MSIAAQVAQVPQRNGFKTMTKLEPNGKWLIQLVRQDAVAVYKTTGWIEYVEQPQPFEAKRAGQGQSNAVQISLEELQRLRELAAKAEKAEAEEKQPSSEPIEKEEEPAGYDIPADVPQEVRRGRGNWKK